MLEGDASGNRALDHGADVANRQLAQAVVKPYADAHERLVSAARLQHGLLLAVERKLVNKVHEDALQRGTVRAWHG